MPTGFSADSLHTTDSHTPHHTTHYALHPSHYTHNTSHRSAMPTGLSVDHPLRGQCGTHDNTAKARNKTVKASINKTVTTKITTRMLKVLG